MKENTKKLKSFLQLLFCNIKICIPNLAINFFSIIFKELITVEKE
jgi:hypothetical protein